MPDMEGRVNFSIHLPDPLLADLDAYVQTQTTRSGVIREAVREYLAATRCRPGPRISSAGCASHHLPRPSTVRTSMPFVPR